MAINNHRRIDNLEEQLASEQARVRFLEDYSDNLGEKVGNLENSMCSVKREVARQKKSLLTILTLVKLISSHRTEKEKNVKFLEMIKSGSIYVFQNAVVFGLVQMIMRLTWLDAIIDSLTGILRMGNILSKKSMERSRFLSKISISITLFMLLKEKIKELLLKLKKIISYLV